VLSNSFKQRYVNGQIRLPQNRQNMDQNRYVSFNKGYALADLTAAYRLTAHVDGLVQSQNITDHYANDFRADFASIGRQTKMGLRIRL
jgi:outer membrane receptor for ferric coprogen and ferric-rhodotorulic acid